MTDREQINYVTKKVYDYAVEICELKQKNYELKLQIVELENSTKDTNVLCQKRKRKFKFMTVKEYCEKTDCQNCEYCFNTFYDKNRVYKKRNGKYILTEVKE